MEVFKESKNSICHNCYNINETCNMNVFMSCGTDSRIGKAFVETCNSFNKKIGETRSSSNTISVANKRETRVEMMGGGHEDPELNGGLE